MLVDIKAHAFYIYNDIFFPYEVGHQNKPHELEPLSNFICDPPVKKFVNGGSRVTILSSDSNRIELALMSALMCILKATKTRWSCHQSGTGVRVLCDIIKGGFIEESGRTFD